MITPNAPTGEPRNVLRAVLATPATPFSTPPTHPIPDVPPPPAKPQFSDSLRDVRAADLSLKAVMASDDLGLSSLGSEIVRLVHKLDIIGGNASDISTLSLAVDAFKSKFNDRG